MDKLDREMKEVLDREDVPTDKRLKLHEQALFRYRNVLDDYRTKPRPSVPPSSPPPLRTPENENLLEIEIMESGPKMHRAKTALLLKKMKTSLWTSFLLRVGVFGEYGLIGMGLCCRLRDLGVLLV
jgi:hypothetical protein